MKPEDIHVNIGEIKVARPNVRLRAILGSCVGIGLLYRSQNLYGLAHCLLPETNKKTFEISGRYVNRAIPSMLRLMKVDASEYKNIRAILFGGGYMTDPKEAIRSKNMLIGAKNVEMAKLVLHKLNIEIEKIDTGGNHGRTISLSCIDGSYEVSKIPNKVAA